MNEHSPQITAKTTEQFEKIAAQLKKLPKHIFEQVDLAENGAVGLTCYINKAKYGGEHKFFFPAGSRQISPFGDYIGVYHDDYFFKIMLPDAQSKQPTITYIIEQPVTK